MTLVFIKSDGKILYGGREDQAIAYIRAHPELDLSSGDYEVVVSGGFYEWELGELQQLVIAELRNTNKPGREKKLEQINEHLKGLYAHAREKSKKISDAIASAGAEAGKANGNM